MFISAQHDAKYGPRTASTGAEFGDEKGLSTDTEENAPITGTGPSTSTHEPALTSTNTNAGENTNANTNANMNAIRATQ